MEYIICCYKWKKQTYIENDAVFVHKTTISYVDIIIIINIYTDIRAYLGITIDVSSIYRNKRRLIDFSELEIFYKMRKLFALILLKKK